MYIMRKLMLYDEKGHVLSRGSNADDVLKLKNSLEIKYGSKKKVLNTSPSPSPNPNPAPTPPVISNIEIHPEDAHNRARIDSILYSTPYTDVHFNHDDAADDEFEQIWRQSTEAAPLFKSKLSIDNMNLADMPLIIPARQDVTDAQLVQLTPNNDRRPENMQLVVKKKRGRPKGSKSSTSAATRLLLTNTPFNEIGDDKKGSRKSTYNKKKGTSATVPDPVIHLSGPDSTFTKQALDIMIHFESDLYFFSSMCALGYLKGSDRLYLEFPVSLMTGISDIGAPQIISSSVCAIYSCTLNRLFRSPFEWANALFMNKKHILVSSQISAIEEMISVDTFYSHVTVVNSLRLRDFTVLMIERKFGNKAWQSKISGSGAVDWDNFADRVTDEMRAAFVGIAEEQTRATQGICAYPPMENVNHKCIVEIQAAKIAQQQALIEMLTAHRPSMETRNECPCPPDLHIVLENRQQLNDQEKEFYTMFKFNYNISMGGPIFS